VCVFSNKLKMPCARNLKRLIVFGVFWNSSRHMLSTRGLERYMNVIWLYRVDGSLLLRTGSLVRLKPALGVHWNSSRHMLSTRGLERYMNVIWLYRVDGSLLLPTGSLVRLKPAHLRKFPNCL
jgi:hypothetical protein